MMLGALIDCGARVEAMNGALGLLGVDGLRIEATVDERGAVRGTYVQVSADGHVQQLRTLEEIVQRSKLIETVKDKIVAVFRRLGQAESDVHGVARLEAQVHELGDMDTLVDVVGSVAGLADLGVERVYSSALPSGAGMVKTAHGLLPVPTPATATLMAMANAPVVPPPGEVLDSGEMVTPTGAAILTTLASFGQPALKLEKVGYGLGTRDTASYPNVLGLWIGKEPGTAKTVDTTLIETNIDDMSPELMGYVQERMLASGARDVWFTPVQMKKNRPGTMLSALVPVDQETTLVDLVLRETSTLGVRVRPVSRYEAEREVVIVETSVGAVPVKVKKLDGVNVAVSPEYDDCSRIARDKNVPLQDIFRIVQEEAGLRLLPSAP